MSTKKYPVGTRLKMPAADDPEYFFEGEVLENVKLPGDICIHWDETDTDAVFSYDETFLDEKTEKIESHFFIDDQKNTFPIKDIIHCDIDTMGAQFLGYVTLESFNKSNCIEHWKQVEIRLEIPNIEYENDIVKGVKAREE